jgi:hypothetical protein
MCGFQLRFSDGLTETPVVSGLGHHDHRAAGALARLVAIGPVQRPAGVVEDDPAGAFWG